MRANSFSTHRGIRGLGFQCPPGTRMTGPYTCVNDSGKPPGWSPYVPQETDKLWVPVADGGFVPYEIVRPAEIGTSDPGEFRPIYNTSPTSPSGVVTVTSPGVFIDDTHTLDGSPQATGYQGTIQTTATGTNGNVQQGPSVSTVANGITDVLGGEINVGGAGIPIWLIGVGVLGIGAVVLMNKK